MTAKAPANWTGPVLLLGGGGMLGRAFRELLSELGHEFVAPEQADSDLTSYDSIRNLPLPEGGLLINCAAYTDVDGAEAKEAEANSVNGQAIGALAALSNDRKARLVTFGTDYVFDGGASSPYKVNALRAPLGAYGRSKALGEEMLEHEGGNWINIRTSWLYAPWGKNFVRTMHKLLKEKKEVRVVNDQRGRPTSAEHLARTSMAAIAKDIKGHFHVTDGGACTWFEFALEIKKLSKAKSDVKPCTTADFPRPARRPAYSVLDIAKTEQLLGPMPNWRDNLADVMQRLEPA